MLGTRLNRSAVEFVGDGPAALSALLLNIGIAPEFVLAILVESNQDAERPLRRVVILGAGDAQVRLGDQVRVDLRAVVIAEMDRLVVHRHPITPSRLKRYRGAHAPWFPVTCGRPVGSPRPAPRGGTASGG